MMTKINYGILLYAMIFISCNNLEEFSIDKKQENIPDNSDFTIEINTTRSIGNILHDDKNVGQTNNPRKISNSSGGPLITPVDPNLEFKEVTSKESIVLPELIPHIWLGNILMTYSVANCEYRPLIYPRNPITVSLTLPGSSAEEIHNPSYSKYASYIQEQIEKGSFAQNDEFIYTIEQFESYHELKVAFGSNVDTNKIFMGSSSSSSSSDHQISKATGLYIKFYQTSFKAVMDYPKGPIANLPDEEINNTVYINSITYGRLGVLTLETNVSVYEAKDKIDKIFKTIFYSNSTSFTKEEQQFLNGCDFKVYLLGGNAATSVQSFNGLSGFIQHIKKGTFNRNMPGVPIFCTFNHVSDNSPLSINFKYAIKKETLYVELIHKPVALPLPDMNKPDNLVGSYYMDLYTHLKKLNGYGSLYLNFYKNKSKIPTIAHPSIPIKVLAKHKYSTSYSETKLETKETIMQNAGYGTSMCVTWPVYHYSRKNGSWTTYNPIIYTYRLLDKPDRVSRSRIWEEDTYEFTLAESNQYSILNNIPLTKENCPLTRYDK